MTTHGTIQIRSGFSLVELSIVLVILGLLTGGILSGRSLIRASELNSVGTDFARLDSAIITYSEQYGGLPGDHNKAFDYFSTNCAATADECNGNNNNSVGDTISGRIYQEAFQSMNHLALAGLIEGKYTGVASTPPIPGKTLIPSKVKNGSFWLYNWLDLTYFRAGLGNAHGGVIQNWINFGAPYPTDVWNANAVISPKEAWKIDTKIDDGKPGLGTVIGTPQTVGCSDNADPAIALYSLTNTNTICKLGYKY